VFVCPNSFLGTAQDQTDWAGIVRVCQAFPSLPVVVTESRISYPLRTLYQALESCPNLHVDLSALWVHHIVEFICREWGAGRLLFGSGLPARDPAAVLGHLNYSDIEPWERAAIAGGNLRRLLSWGNSPLPSATVDLPEPIDELHAQARENQPLRGQGFLCSHGHLGPHPLVHVPDGSTDELLNEMDRLGVDQAIIFTDGGLNSDEAYGNDQVATAAREHPSRFIGFVTANLNRPPDDIRREIRRGFSMGLRGIKLHAHLNAYDTNGPHVEVACALANERRTFIINHDWGDAQRMLYLCHKYPHACLITGHTSTEAASVIEQVENLYIGSCPLNGFGSTELFVERVGADRILLGTDLSWCPIAWGLGPVLYARIPLAAKRLILGGNLRRLLRQYDMAPTNR
jgi:predicted TIM-barrel fold metal-dependent hydrolase